MSEKRILAEACAYLGVSVGQVLSYRVYEDHVALVVDRGIAGCPKYKIPLAELPAEPKKEEAEPEEKAVKPKTKRRASRS